MEVPETMLTLKGSLYLFVRTGKCTLDPKSVSVLYTYYVCFFFLLGVDLREFGECA